MGAAPIVVSCEDDETLLFDGFTSRVVEVTVALKEKLPDWDEPNAMSTVMNSPALIWPMLHVTRPEHVPRVEVADTSLRLSGIVAVTTTPSASDEPMFPTRNR